MSAKEYVGYGAPPKASRFKPGNREHLKRRKRNESNVTEDLIEFLSEPITYREGRKTKRGRRIDVHLLKTKKAALKGDLVAAEALIDMRENPGKFAKFTKITLVFEEGEALI